MNENIYQAPESRLVEEVTTSAFYVVAPRKFLILFISTLGVYAVYWFYKNWALYKEASGTEGWPVMRGIFSIFFAHSLFKLIDEKLKKKGEEFSGSPSTTATIYVTLSLAGNIFDRLATKNIGEPFTYIVSILTFPFLCWSLYKAQISANTACGDPTGKRNEKLTPLNYLWVVVGLLLWILTAVGLYDIMIGIPE